jgi:hypothetical protein
VIIFFLGQSLIMEVPTMNTRHCVHFASQGSVGSDSLALSRLSNNELTSIGIYYRLVVNNGVVCWFMLGHQQPDYYYTGKGRAAYWEDRDGFGKCVAAGVHFYQLRVDEAPFPAEDGNPQRLRSASKAKRNDSMSDQELLIDIGSFFNFINK